MLLDLGLVAQLEPLLEPLLKPDRRSALELTGGGRQGRLDGLVSGLLAARMGL